MSLRHHAGAQRQTELAPTAPEAEASVPAADLTSSARPQSAPPARVPRTRTGAAWVTLIAAALVAVLLIVFLAQNTRGTEISFLWMSTNTPLAVALLIAAVGSALLTLIIGTARIAQLRRLVRRDRK
jgi:uncharacterized integral membrane protein